MKRFGITQRVEIIPSYGERRDCLDQRWSQLAWELDSAPVPLPNIEPEKLEHLLDALSLDGIILSGGNSVSKFDMTASDAAPERDEFETALVNSAVARSIPVMGVCRGMQMINCIFGGSLTRVFGHVGVRHAVLSIAELENLVQPDVNSFHNWGVADGDLASCLEPTVWDADGNIEGFSHKTARVTGITWHPERESPMYAGDLDLMRKALT